MFFDDNIVLLYLYHCMNIIMFAFAQIISFYMSSLIAYRTQTWVPQSLRDPHITRVLGTPGPQIPSDMGAWGPHITRNMGTGVSKLGGPHFTRTLDFVFGTESLGSMSPVVQSTE